MKRFFFMKASSLNAITLSRILAARRTRVMGDSKKLIARWFGAKATGGQVLFCCFAG